MPDSILILKHLINNVWMTFSSIPFFDWPGISFADVFVGIMFWNILWFLIHTFAFRRGDGFQFFGSVQDYGRSAFAKNAYRKKSKKMSNVDMADFIDKNT